MSSSLVVPVARIDEVAPHPNADRLEVARVLGWQVVVGKGQHQAGQEVVYFPPDTVLPEAVADLLGVSRYLSNGRVRCARLRGEPSFGFVATPTRAWPIGSNVAAHYGAMKYEPPIRPHAGDSEPEHPLFARYTSIENMRNFPDVLVEGEEVVLDEKIHGTNSRIGMVEGRWVAGSHRLQRKRPTDSEMVAHTYWFPYTLPGVRGLVGALGDHHKQVVLYGEVYGRVQSLHYGTPGGLGYRAFDLLVDGAFVDHEKFQTLCEEHGVPAAPIVARGPFSLDFVRQHAGGKTLLDDTHIREGVVVRPLRERADPKVGRVILKYISDAYLFGEASDYTEV